MVDPTNTSLIQIRRQLLAPGEKEFPSFLFVVLNENGYADDTDETDERGFFFGHGLHGCFVLTALEISEIRV